ncbi:FtsX-like permease family protein [Albimonas sp. CAU 1670]|nr:FtsX-like permease family protein [Albimonas sp. CAU 1670]MDF2234880.1 FtsX-like permease family protein [Albimonas sp. CAU 1670]
MWTLRVLTSHWRRRPLQLLALLVGLAAATALWSGVQALNAQARDSYARAASAFSGAQVPALVPLDGGPIPEAAFAELRRAGWPVSPLIEGWIEAGPPEAPDRLRLLGVEPATLPPAAGLALASGAEPGADPGAEAGADPSRAVADFILPPGRLLLSPQTLSANGWAEGERPATPRGPLPPLVASDAPAPGVALADIAYAQALLGMEGRLSRLLLDPERAPPGAPEGWRRTAPEPRVDPGRLAGSFHLNLTAFGGLSFIVGLFIVHGAVGLAVEQRRPLFRTLRACGLSARALGAALAIELGAGALLAGLAGVALGYLVAAALLPDVAASLRGLYGARVPGALSLSPAWWAAGLGMSLLGAAAAAGPALLRAARTPPLESARPEAWRAAHARAARRQALAAAALALAALALGLFGTGLVAGFALLGAILGAAALGLPPLLGLALAGAARLSSAPLWRWAAADGRQQLPGLSLALASLLLALSANIGVGTMVDGFRLTFLDWLDQRLVAEAYVRADPGAADRLESWLSARPEIEAVLPEPRAETVVDGWPVQLAGVTDHPGLRASWPLLASLPDAWDRVAAGEATLVSEQFARRFDLAPGASFALDTPTGPWPLTVAGVYADYGNAKGELRLAAPALVARWPEVEQGRFALRLDPAAVPGLLSDLARAPRAGAAEALDQGRIRALSRAVFERTFAVTAALNALTLGVAAIALLTALLTLAETRLPQVAPLWAMGVRRRRLAGIELSRILALAALTAALAVPLGVGVAWALTAVVNVEAFGWRLPLHLFPGQWARLALLAVAVAGIAAAIPLLRLVRTPPARLAKVFADER